MPLHPIYEAQLNRVLDSLDLARYNGNTIFVSGGTGMIGCCILDLLTLWNKMGGRISLISSGRDPEQAKKSRDPEENIQWIGWDITEPLVLPKDISVDYLIHTAGNADPVNFSKYPVETLWGAISGTRSMLEFAKNQKCKRVLYLSSGEMYGQPLKKENGDFVDFTEDYCGEINHQSPRSCYPMGKRGSEVLCQSYLAQYQVPTVIARPCHIFGPTMKKEDSRAISEFFRNAQNGEDIVLKSQGLMERSHCYVVDCVGALFFLLEHGEIGEAYNIADKRYQMTIRELAEAVAKAGGTQVRFEIPDEIQAKGFSPVTRAVLCGGKLGKLGWRGLDSDVIEGMMEVLGKSKP